MAIELEIKLSVQDGFINEVMNLIEHWPSSVGFELKFLKNREHSDLYFDTVGKNLFARGVYLRLRYHSNSQLKEITYRAFSAIGYKVMQLTEVNEELTNSTLEKVILLVGRLTKVDTSNQILGLDPSEALFQIGFQQILTADTHRNVFVIEHEAKKIGLLMVDRSIFHVESLLVPYDEIEIRGLDEHSVLLDAIIIELLNQFAGILQITTTSKLERALTRKNSYLN